MFSFIRRKIFLGSVLMLSALSPFVLSISSCGNEEVNQVLSELLVQVLASWNANEEKLDEIPQDVVIHDQTGEIPASVDLTSKFPPVGDQGSYGTCVVWAVGYNLKTALNSMDNKWTASQLSMAENQTSPKDLFYAIPNSQKGADCNGTQFEPALDALITRGGASLATAPYANLGNCSQTPPAEWTSNAAANKLINYRKIADKSNSASMTAKNFKSYLAEGRPIAFGARLGDRFMKWNSDAVIDFDTYNNPGMQHAYHAMVLVGYNDTKNAFKVLNTWGKTWGNNGTIWVDYDFFLNNFCFAGFVAQNKTDVNVSGGQVGSGDITTGLDVLTWNLVDEDNPEQTDPLARQITYNVFNSGTLTVNSSSRWSILYMYYNAYNANDYGILIHDYYTDEYSTTLGENGFLQGGLGIAGSWWNYINVPSGQSVAGALYNDPEANFLFTYSMPSTLTGSYYLVLIADGFNDLTEANEDNNYFFYSKADGKPFDFLNGVIQSDDKSTKSRLVNKMPAKFANTANQTLVSSKNVNTYSPNEIMKMIEYRKKTGDIQRKADQLNLKKSTSTANLKRIAK